MAAIRTNWQKIQAYIWLVCGVGCLFFALVFWAITDKEDLVHVEKEAESEVELQIQPEKVAATNHLGALYDEVKPLDMNTRVVVTAQHEAEFRGTKFVNEMKNQQTIELFRTSDEDILKSFLQKQPDRHPFFYLRLSGEGQSEQYVLLYGAYKTEGEATNALESLKLNLPISVKPKIESFQTFIPYVNDLGSDELGVNTKLYNVKLSPVALPRVNEGSLANAKVVQNNNSELAKSDTVTTTTVTRKALDGKVIDVQRSHSGSAPNQANEKAPEKEISDPFN